MPTIVKNRMANEPKNRAPAITNQRFGWEKCLWHAIAHERGKKSSALHCRIHARSLALCQFRNNERVICSTVTCANDHHHTHFVVAPTLIAKSHGWCILSISSLFDTLRIPSRHPQLKLCTVNSAHTQKMQNRRRAENEKKILRKRSKNQHLKLEIVSFVRFEITSSFFHSLHSAVHSFIRSHVFCEFSCFWNAIDFFRSSARSLCVSFVLFPLSQSVFILC